MGDAHGGPWSPQTSGASSLRRAFIWPDSSWGWVRGEEFSSRGKTTAGSELSSIGCNLLESARALSVAMATSSISFEVIAGNVPTFRIALIEAQGIHLCNNLMHVLVHHVLLGGKMGKLLLCTLAGVGCIWCRHLALVSQCHHLCGNSFNQIVVRLVLTQNPEGILLMRHRGGISFMACSGGSSVKPLLESLLDHGSQGNPCLGCKR
jgi:hypothetical protein